MIRIRQFSCPSLLYVAKLVQMYHIAFFTIRNQTILAAQLVECWPSKHKGIGKGDSKILTSKCVGPIYKSFTKALRLYTIREVYDNFFLDNPVK